MLSEIGPPGPGEEVMGAASVVQGVGGYVEPRQFRRGRGANRNSGGGKHYVRADRISPVTRQPSVEDLLDHRRIQ